MDPVTRELASLRPPPRGGRTGASGVRREATAGRRRLAGARRAATARPGHPLLRVLPRRPDRDRHDEDARGGLSAGPPPAEPSRDPLPKQLPPPVPPPPHLLQQNLVPPDPRKTLLPNPERRT